MKAYALEVGSGTVCGADHLGNRGVPSASNNQDAHIVRPIGDSVIAVVSDGCSDRPKSGVGAELLCQFFAAAAEEILPTLEQGKGANAAARIQDRLVESMTAQCTLCAGTAHADDKAAAKARARVADDLFLCTLVGTIVTPRVTVVFAAGDGVWSVNSQTVKELGPFPKNEPPYLGYLIRGNPPVTPKLELLFEAETDSVQRVTIGSDGCADIPPDILASLVTGHDTFENPETINRALRRLNSQTIGLKGNGSAIEFRVTSEWSERKLEDDTTLVVIRRVLRPVREEIVEAAVKPLPKIEKPAVNPPAAVPSVPPVRSLPRSVVPVPPPAQPKSGRRWWGGRSGGEGTDGSGQ